ncbi:MAG: hypothetical protein FJZ07_00085 [Candidatus Nealsonbacteria bacterium]|nr:hypothetical protein [Candidatus Nealsonbacteria bacterium]
MEQVNSCQEEYVLLLGLPREPALEKIIEIVLFFFEEGDGVDIGVDITLDFSDVGIVRAGTLGKMVELREVLEARRRRLSLVNVRPKTLGIFEITCLDEVFTINGGNTH